MKSIEGNFENTEVNELLKKHFIELRSVSPEGSTHVLDIDGLKDKSIKFWSLWENNDLIGCGALKTLSEEHGEFKSIRVADKFRKKKYGEKLIRSCIASGTDYVDLCGEPGFMHKIISECSAEAKQNGSRVIFSCGFDSIPFDLGVFLVQEEVMSKIGKYAPSVRGRVRAMNGEFSGGTAASMKATMSSLKTNPELINVLINPHGLCEGINGVQQEDDTKPKYDEELDVWFAPFFMAPINTKNIHRSNKLMNHIYGKDFLYNEMWITGPGEEGKAAAEMLAGNNPIAGDDVPAPGEGPSREKRENGNYDILFCADVDGKVFKASVSGDMDPGYGSTSKMITESAICLVKDAKELEGGIYTPAAALGNKLISRLEANAGLTFIIE